MRVSSLILSIIGCLLSLVCAIIALFTGLAKHVENYDYVEAVVEVIDALGGDPWEFSEGDFDRLLILGALALIATIAGIVGASLSMPKSLAAACVLFPVALVSFIAAVAAYISIPALLGLGIVVALLFAVAASLSLGHWLRERYRAQ